MGKFSLNKRILTFLLAGILMSVILLGSAVYILWQLGFGFREVFKPTSANEAKIIKFEIGKAKEIMGM